ncbi:lytic murein transglycosylase [Shimia sp. R11_0]|uniref:lytic murein transglycosylase n=1 Tax=Shimia sp. R11_0 TaxID=2821096 RepID=UPI001ADC9301|nr:lytic murein transglycosylase [Shimia sp. R11_0]MBO9476250.1 lytic murein transglycosylase [Shimia sp. R11_0]
MWVQGILVGLVLGTTAVAAVAAPAQSLRPVLRPATVTVVSSGGTIPYVQKTAAPVASQRPVLRPIDPEIKAPEAQPVAAANKGFQRWIDGYRSRALKAGISAAVFDRAFRGVEYNTDVIQRDRNQSEFTKTIWEYLDSAASDTRVKNGKAALKKHRKTLERIEAHYGVDKEVVVAVWGLESNYGTYKGTTPIIEALATLSYDGRRGKFFEQQLTAALKIIQSGDVRPQNMTGSWAGAMGHTQFIPTSYLAFAVDFTGDGKRDIWSDDPTDALASTAAYLKRSGWVTGQPWGVEVQLPKGFNYALASRKIQKSPSEWARLGVRDMQGRKVPNHGKASILLPAGGRGVAFMIFKNFAAIERYNAADAYVIGVGHLSDRIKGGSEFQGKWPRGDRALTFKERKELQRRLTRAGFDTQGVDGKIGPITIEAVRAYQRSVGATPDGYASLTLLKSLR